MSTDLEAYEIGDCESCADEINPKNMLRKLRRSSKSFGDVVDPIAEELRDPDLAQRVYANIPIVPFFDDSDATLRVLRRMRELSPTHSGCIESKSRYAFAGELTTRRYIEPGMAMDTETAAITDAEKEEMIDFVNSLGPEMTMAHVLQTIIDLDDNYETYGNSFLRLDAVTVGGKEHYYIASIDAEKCRYYATERFQPKLIVISPDWTQGYIDNNPPEFVNVFPEWSEFGNGVKSSIIHTKRSTRGRDWYALPGSFGSIYWQYMEIQQGQYGTRGYANDFVARVFFEITAEPDDDDTGDDFDNAVEKTFTNQAGPGGPKRYIIRRRLPDDQPAVVHEFKPNTDFEFHQTMSEIAKRQIVKTHNWHDLLLGEPTTGRLGGSTEFKEVYRVYYNNVIRGKQELGLRPITAAFRAFETMQKGKTDVTSRLSLGLFNLYQKYLDIGDDQTKQVAPGETAGIKPESAKTASKNE
jgi:hypothetical protein